MIRSTTVSMLLLVPAALAPHRAAAQISGTVTDTSGAPIQGVVVEAWNDDVRLDSRITDVEGMFAFPEEVAERATVLRAGRLGYSPLVRTVEPGRGEYRLELQEEPIALEGLTVELERNTCEIEDSEAARRLWNRVRSRYAGPMDTVGIATYLAEAETLVARDEIGPLDVPDRMLSQRGSSSQLRFSWTRQVRRGGYAFPVRRTDSGESFDSWSYAPLEADFAPHFVDSLFGELHRFRIRDRGDHGWTLEFCPRDRDGPSIRGTMRIDPDTTLASVEWLYRTPEPDENAGGRAFFPDVKGPPAQNYPLPRESIVWRELPTGRFQEVHQRFEGWIVAQGDTVPFLPPREPERR